ncbi:uncharacterized protein K444DRAFT_403855 [Hyaloscypha bicolor E]|uniref:Uncharacterized protein n=1 Tax=Hyaloscypha bicolor E TaxID=1095630 RepID=A0A2J6TAF9_9HELO|nr:uncharacterized protein K444DRAFT_403855 [Hyaloscypha bicolor E]PMD60010.1 hypothetical protein K444DRAFT_403855 [Hyaloscypha bicolor E]
MMQAKHIWQTRRRRFADSSNTKPHLHPDLSLRQTGKAHSKRYPPNQDPRYESTRFAIVYHHFHTYPTNCNCARHFRMSGTPIRRSGILAPVRLISRDINYRHQKRAQIDGYISAVLHYLSVSGMKMFDCTALNDEKLSWAFWLPFTSSTAHPCSYTVKYTRTCGVTRGYGVLSGTELFLFKVMVGNVGNYPLEDWRTRATADATLEAHGRRDSREKRPRKSPAALVRQRPHLPRI